MYEATGIYPARTYFAIDRETHFINVTRDLKMDGLATTKYEVAHLEKIYFFICGKVWKNLY